MTFSSFTIKAPEIAPGELARDGDTVTITGAFFGDTKGEVRLAYRDNGVVVDNAKVVDWSMDAIRIRLPAGLAGRFIVKVQNAIGKDYALFDLGDGPPTLVGMVWPTGYGKFDSSDNARGIWYNGKLWVWSIWWTPDTYKQMTSDNMYRIQYRTFQNGQLSGASQLWGGETYAEPAPILVQYPNGGPQKMFVFITGKNGNIYFTRLNGTVWEDGDWIKITDPATGGVPTSKMNDWEVAPVYNPETHRLYVYYAKDYNDYLHYAYSDDFGTTWHTPGLAPNSPIIKAAPSAIFYKPAGGTTDVLLAMKDVNQKIRLCKFAGGTVRQLGGPRDALHRQHQRVRASVPDGRGQRQDRADVRGGARGPDLLLGLVYPAHRRDGHGNGPVGNAVPGDLAAGPRGRPGRVPVPLAAERRAGPDDEHVLALLRVRTLRDVHGRRRTTARGGCSPRSRRRARPPGVTLGATETARDCTLCTV